MHEFLNSNDPDKRTNLVASLLDQPDRYAENWITWWNDLLRNDEGVTYYSETATRKSITTWLLDALQTNKPYDQMIHELMNPTTPKDPDGFLIGVNWRGTLSASQTPAMQASQNTAQIFLGINFKCNSCHDSFISKWKLKDSYALAAYFSAEDKLPLYRCDVLQEGQFATPAYMYPELDHPLPSSIPVSKRRLPRFSPIREMAVCRGRSSIGSGRSSWDAGSWRTWTIWMASRGAPNCWTGWLAISCSISTTFGISLRRSSVRALIN